MTSPTSQPTAERVGRYQLLEPIGTGPSGAVSRAKVFGVAGFERQFAIKRFHPDITASTALAQSLSAAARGYGSLEHPRIARMSEFGVAQGTTFTAVEFVAGLDALRLVGEARLAGVALAAGGALALVSQAARAVGYAHGRGLTHLGLAPTNVIVTSEGDIKITDFGILASTLPARPIDALRLASRIGYMAPEQLAGEATSAATDVFSLGVLALELVTGHRAFAGDTPHQVAAAVLAGPPAEPPLPRPIVRVLQRCLARSPFERFPDARALADALDAALRVAPVPGTRKDIGAQVKQAMDRLAAMSEGEHSGILSLNLVANQPTRREPISAIPVLGNKSPAADALDLTALEAARPGGINKPMTTVAGLAPPPIPVPPGVTPPPTPGKPPVPAAGKPSAPRMPTGALKPLATTATIPTIPARGAPAAPAAPAGSTVAPRRPPMINAGTKPGLDPAVQVPDGQPLDLELSNDIEIQIEKVTPFGGAAGKPETDPGTGLPRLSPAERQQRPTNEMSAAMSQQLQLATTKPTRDLAAADAMPDELEMSFAETAIVSDAQALAVPEPAAGESNPDLGRTVLGTAAPASRVIATKPGFEPPRSQAPTTPLPLSGSAPPAPAPLVAKPLPPTPVAILPLPPPLPGSPQPLGAPPVPLPPASPKVGAITADVRAHRGGGRGTWIAVGILGVAALGVGGVLAYQQFLAPRDGTPAPVASASPDAAVTAVAPPADAPGATPAGDDARVAAVAASDAGAAGDGSATAPATGDVLAIASTPPGARVFIDGADSGVTPLSLPGTADKHSIALFLPSHELYVAQVDGRGTFSINLKTVTPWDGPAGIKVTRCKDKERFYVAVDGKPTGQTCPTERIETTLGPHTVEIYDLHTEKHTEYKIDVTDTRLSYRVKVDP